MNKQTPPPHHQMHEHGPCVSPFPSRMSMILSKYSAYSLPSTRSTASLHVLRYFNLEN